MELFEVAKKLNGLQTVSSIAKTLDINERTAINYAWKLRRNGYLKNVPGGKIKIYRISPLIKKKNGYSFYELLNKYSKVKIAVKEDYIIHSDKEPSVEELLVRAVKTQNFRVILASLGLFNKVKDWSKLKYFSERYNLEKKIGALYDVARETMRARRMDKRTSKGFLKGKGSGYIIKNMKSRDFKHIEKKWNVRIPFNKADIRVYKE